MTTRTMRYLLWGMTGTVLLLLGMAFVQLAIGKRTLPAENPVVPVIAQGQTEPVKSRGDAADDPAIWHNPSDPANSRVLGTNKKRGLDVYDLQGQRVQEFPIGRLNNVDLRQGVPMNGQSRDLAVATNIDDDSLVVFEILSNGRVMLLGSVPTELDEIYGICLYFPGEELHVFANAKDGRYLQYRLTLVDDLPVVEPLRYFRLDSTPEGCVVHDDNDKLYVGEEHGGVWVMRADPGAGTAREMVIEAVDPLEPDIEGLALYGENYLIISSQGNHRFAVLDALPPYRLRGLFQIEADDRSGIGNVRDTDGIEVSDSNFGPGFESGLVVLQDGENEPHRQNFKYLSWANVAEALELVP